MGSLLHSQKNRRILALLIRERKKRKLTQGDISTRLGRPQSYISKIENGEKRLLLVEYLEIAKAIGFSASEALKDLE